MFGQDLKHREEQEQPAQREENPTQELEQRKEEKSEQDEEKHSAPHSGQKRERNRTIPEAGSYAPAGDEFHVSSEIPPCLGRKWAQKRLILIRKRANTGRIVGADRATINSARTIAVQQHAPSCHNGQKLRKLIYSS